MQTWHVSYLGAFSQVCYAFTHSVSLSAVPSHGFPKILFHLCDSFLLWSVHTSLLRVMPGARPGKFCTITIFSSNLQLRLKWERHSSETDALCRSELCCYRYMQADPAKLKAIWEPLRVALSRPHVSSRVAWIQYCAFLTTVNNTCF